MTHIKILELCAGRARMFGSGEQAWSSAILKTPLAGNHELTANGLCVDHQVDKKHHGGSDKALLALPVGQYSGIKSRFNRELSPGSMGENLLLDCDSESAFCLGDCWEIQREGLIGKARLEVSQARQPCWKPGRANGIEGLASWMSETAATGFYLRVVSPGSIAAGDTIRLVSRPHPDWTIPRCWFVYSQRKQNPDEWCLLESLPELAQSWKAD